MLQRIRRRLRRLCAVLAVGIALCLCTPAFALSAQSDQLTVKVAFCRLDGFFDYDAQGNPCGYGVDYLNELKKYANITWEYVPVDSWEAIPAMMARGEVDVRMPASPLTNPEDQYDFTVEPMISTYHAIMTLKTRTDLYYEDNAAIAKMKIAICANQLDRTGISSYLQAIGAADGLIYYPDYNACRAALDAGEVDALISNVMDLTDDMKILDKFAAVDNYITTLKGNPCYVVINDATTQLKLKNPTYQSTLYQQYYPERGWEPFTKEEYAYIESTPYLRVAVYSNRKPVSYLDDDGNFCGIAIDMGNLLSQYMGIPFVYCPVTTPRQTGMLNQADLVMPVPSVAESDDYFVTQSILNTEILMAVQSQTVDLAQGDRVGVLSTTPGIRDTIEGLQHFDVRVYDTNREAFNALQRGEIDAFANSSFVVNWMMQNPRYSMLKPLRFQNFPLAFAISGKAENAVLYSLLSKAIQRVSDEQRDTITSNGTKLMMDDFTLADRFYVYRWPLLAILIAMVLTTLIFVLYIRSRNRYIKEIEESSRKLEQANRAKSDFLSRMSHDMRTPMNGILGLTSLLADRTNPEEIRADVEQIELSGKYLLRLINDTLDMSKIESGKMELHPEPIAREELFTNVMTTTGILAAKKGVHLNMTVLPATHDQPLAVMADASRVEQILMNLLSNAVKFTPPGGTVTMKVDTIAVTDDVVTDRFIVSDTGIGMSEDFLKHLFEPFAQEGRRSTAGDSGTGLGLAIVKTLVDMMEGSITVESRVNEGTTFTVTLQYPHCHAAVSAKHSEVSDWSGLRGKRILLCEDHPVNTKIAIRLLEKEGMLVASAVNGQIGTEMFSQSPIGYYDAILMDIRMPVMDGITAAKTIRAMTDRADAATIPILAMTANAFDEDRKATKAAGMNAHLAKPIEPERLYRALLEAIR